MIAAVDSSIILDILLDDRKYVETSMNLLVEYHLKGAVIICPVVFSECAASLNSPDEFGNIANEMGLRYEPFTAAACALAAKHWRQYRVKGGQRKRILSDFLIGAHAQVSADVFLTRDRGFYRKYFKNLRIISALE